MQIVLYVHEIKRVSGITTFTLNFVKNLYSDYDITIVCDKYDQSRIAELGNYAKIVINNFQDIECDVCLFVTTVRMPTRIKAKAYYQICHSDFKKWGVDYIPQIGIGHIAVSDTVKKSLQSDFGVESIVIPNLLAVPTNKYCLRLLTASRIAQGKGFERMIDLARKIKAAEIPFVWEIYGSGDNFYPNLIKSQCSDIPELVFMGDRLDVQPYMLNVDYVVQLSDSEGFCYAIYEALQVKTAVLVTMWKGVEQIVRNGVNGYILDFDLSNLNVENLCNCIPKQIEPMTISAKPWHDLFSSVGN